MKEIEIPEGYEAKIEDNKVIFVQKESEDERIRKILIHIVKGACDKYGIKYIGDEIGQEKLLAYLEKQKEQKPAEWSEEDERTLESFLGWLQGSMGEKTYSSWLKSLPERFSLKPKQEWSEEDKMKIVELKTFIAQCNGFNKANRQKAFNMIDALRPSWKPSKEQIEALNAVANEGVLLDLFNDLLKLL